MNTKHILSLIASPLLLASSLSAQVFLNDIDWFTGTDPVTETLTVDTNTWTQTLGENATVVGYFAQRDNPLQVGVGQALRLDFTVSFSGTPAGGFRFGLFDTSSTTSARINDDGFGWHHPSFTDDVAANRARGTMLTFDTMNAGAGVSFRLRNTNASAENILQANGGYFNLSEGSLAEAIVENREYFVSFDYWNISASENINHVSSRIWYLDEQNEKVYIYDGSREYNSDPSNATYVNSFDTLAIFASSAAGDSFTVSDLSIDVISSATATYRFRLETSEDMTSWQEIPMTPDMLSPEGELLFDSDKNALFFRLRIEQ